MESINCGVSSQKSPLPNLTCGEEDCTMSCTIVTAGRETSPRTVLLYCSVVISCFEEFIPIAGPRPAQAYTVCLLRMPSIVTTVNRSLIAKLDHAVDHLAPVLPNKTTLPEDDCPKDTAPPWRAGYSSTTSLRLASMPSTNQATADYGPADLPPDLT